MKGSGGGEGESDFQPARASCCSRRLAGEEEKIPVLSRLPWEGLGASDRAREAAGEVKAAVIALADDRAT